MVAPQTSSPGIVTSNSDNATQAMIMQAMLSNMKEEQAAPIRAAIAAQARKNANTRYMRDAIRKVGPALTNGSPTQAYVLQTPLTFNLSTALNGYVEGILVRVVLNYTLATGTGATYALTAAGKLGIIDTIEVRYNKSQAKFRPYALRQLALAGGLPEFTLPDTIWNGQHDTVLDAWVNPTMPVAAGANSTTLEFYVPLNLISPDAVQGVLPLMAGDTGIQVIVNTPQNLLAQTTVNVGDPVLNALYWSGGTGPGISAISGTVQVSAVFRDGDCFYSTNKLPYDISAVEGTFQMQIDQLLTPLVAGQVQRTKLNVMGYHYYVLLLVIDALQPTSCATDNNIVYLESAKDGLGGNVFFKYGLQTNLSYNDWLFLNRIGWNQDLDPGCILMVKAPIRGYTANEFDRQPGGYLDNTRNGWADWRYGVQVSSVGTGGNGPRIEPHVFYVNPTGLVPV